MALSGAVRRDCGMPLCACARGGARWYAAHAGEGRERALAARLYKSLSPDACIRAFAPEWEVVRKRHGSWESVRKPVFPGYAIVESADPGLLLREVSALPFSVSFAGRLAAGGLACVEPELQRWLASAMGEGGVLFASEGEIRGGALHVTRGPLAGSEALVRRVDRHKRTAWLGFGEGGSAFALRAGLSVPVRV